MSTILKALKKLEQETQSAGTAAAFQTLSDRPTDPPTPPRNRLWAGIGIGVSLVGLGVVLFFLLRPAAPPTTPQPQAQSVPTAPPKVATAPEDRLPIPKVFPPRQPGDPKTAEPSRVRSTDSAAQTAVAPTPGAQMPAPPAPPAQRPAKAVTSQPPLVAEAPSQTLPPNALDTLAPKLEPGPKAKPMTAPAITPAAEPTHTKIATPEAAPVPQPSPPVASTEPAPPPPTPHTQPATTAPSKEAPPQKPVAPAQPATPAPQPATVTEETLPEAPVDPYANVSRLEANSPIKLQAISWSQAAGKSIAVINNNVLHEGDSVEGYSVVKIRPDDVIVRREGRMWRANFSIR